MLHIDKKIEKSYKKSLAIEVFVGMMLFSIFHTSITQASDITADNVINLVNSARKNIDVAALAKNELLQKAAQEKAQDMIDNNYFAHISPDGKSPWFWIEKEGYDYQYAGENLAINYTNANEEQKAWMDSPLHRKNILNPVYNEIGVAVKEGVIDGHKTTIAVQMFGAQQAKESIAPVISDASSVKPIVAGAANIASMQQNIPIAENVDNFDLNSIYQKNKPTLNGWLFALMIVIFVVIIDVAALVHRKHKQLFILHDVRNKQA
jgi:hypothetical protein